MAPLRKPGVVAGRSVQAGAGLLQPVDALLVDACVGHDLRRAEVQPGLGHAQERARDATVAVGAAHVRRNPVAVGNPGLLEFVVFVIVFALTGACVAADGGNVGDLLKLHVRVDLDGIDLAGVGRHGIDGDAAEDVDRLRLHGRVDLGGIDAVVVGLLGSDGDAGEDVARLTGRLHVRVDLRGIDLSVVGRRDFIDLIRI